MTNHVRTLLLNLRAVVATPPAGEEYVPPDYRPATLPPVLAAGRAALFGPSPSRAGINLNLARLLAYLHTSPLRDDVFLADTRITYDPYAPPPDTDVTATDYNFVSAADGFPDADTLFRSGRTAAGARWLEYWLDTSLPAPLRASALALALAARTADVISGRYPN